MRIAFDASALAKPQRTGIARYGICLIDALLQRTDIASLTLGYRLSRWRRRRFLYRGPATRADVRVRYFTETARTLWLGDHDVFHGLDARLPRRSAIAAVATLHDVNQLELPEIASRGFRDRKADHFRRLAEEAHRIICVSAATRDAFLARYPVAQARMAVIHHGLLPQFRAHAEADISATLATLGIAPPYLLFVGLVSSRKNCVRLIEAFDRVADVPVEPDGRPATLVLAGGSGHGFDEVAVAIAGARARARIRLLGFVADAHLPALYAGATAFVFPGLAEGFGMPMLEAMACRTAVVAADNAVTNEVAGDAAMRVDATEPEAIAQGLRTILTDPALRAALVQRGQARAAQFTWDAAAAKTLAVYRDVSGVNGGADP